MNAYSHIEIDLRIAQIKGQSTVFAELNKCLPGDYILEHILLTINRCQFQMGKNRSTYKYKLLFLC